MSAASGTLAGCGVLLVLLRLHGCRNRREAVSFLLILVSGALAGLAPNRDPPAGLLALAVLWSAGWHSGIVQPPSRLASLSLVVGLLALLPALASGSGFQGKLPFILFRLFVFELCAGYFLLRLMAGRRRGAAAAPMPWVIALAAEALALGAAAAARDGLLPDLRYALWSGMALALVGGHRLAQEGYLREASRRDLARRLEERERQLRWLRARLMESENSARLEDGLAGAGLLAAGAAHEFRNILALIQAAAEFGLQNEQAGRAAHSLRQVLDHARQGTRAAEELLQRAGGGKRSELDRLELPGDLAGILRLARSSCRRDGIRLSVAQSPAVMVLAVRGDLEQILLNLIRNAAAMLRRHRRPGEGSIHIGFLPPEEPGGPAAVEVRDNGPGVDPRLGSTIFEPSVSSTGSTGLGLYLARRLAENGGGGLQYVPRGPDQGGCFRLLLPSPS